MAAYDAVLGQREVAGGGPQRLGVVVHPGAVVLQRLVHRGEQGVVGAHHRLEDRAEVGLDERVAAVAGDAGEVVAGALDLRGPGVELGEVDGHHGVHRGSCGVRGWRRAVPDDVPRPDASRNRSSTICLPTGRAAAGCLGLARRGYPAEVSESGKRSLMQVEPDQAGRAGRARPSASSTRWRQDWADAVDELAEACAALGDATGTANVAASYADALADAGEVVTALAEALELGVAGLVDAAQDAVRADDTVAAELDRAAHQLGEAAVRPACRDREVADRAGQPVGAARRRTAARGRCPAVDRGRARWCHVAVTRSSTPRGARPRAGTPRRPRATSSTASRCSPTSTASPPWPTGSPARCARQPRIITSSQKELDQAWTKVAVVPHEVVGESRYLVFKPSERRGPRQGRPAARPRPTRSAAGSRCRSTRRAPGCGPPAPSSSWCAPSC